MADFHYYWHDNALFRRPAGAFGSWIEDVYFSKQNRWAPYEGDRLEPYWYGRRVDEAKAAQLEPSAFAAPDK